jgi:hypothetical protein
MLSYREKIESVIKTNIFERVFTNIVEKVQERFTQNINNNNTIINIDTKWKYIDMNPQIPNICGLIKLHKQN